MTDLRKQIIDIVANAMLLQRRSAGGYTDEIMALLKGHDVEISRGSYGPDWCGIDCSLKKCPYAIHDGMSGPCKPGPDCPGPGKYRLVRIGDS